MFRGSGGRRVFETGETVIEFKTMVKVEAVQLVQDINGIADKGDWLLISKDTQVFMSPDEFAKYCKAYESSR